MKPVILIGAGCPASLAEKLCALGVPVLTTWQAADRVPEDSPVFCGRPGVVGQRAANIIQQNAGTIYIFGARLDMEQVGHRLDNFAPNAIKHVYDVDPRELAKLPASWICSQQDLSKDFPIPRIRSQASWLPWCKNLYAQFRSELDGVNVVEDFADPYYFTRELSDACTEGEIIVPGSSGMQSCALLQAFRVKRGQKIILCNTIGAMGLEPMAIGAALASGRRVVCVTGDGGFYQNMQELEVAKRLGLQIKYFVFCNGGYGSITTMQDARFNRRVGADESSGFTLPDLSRVAAVWGFPFYEIRNNADTGQILAILNAPHTCIIRVHTTLAFRYACKVNSSLKDGVFETDDMADMTPKIPNLQELMSDN
jgi:acetolactate synthase-1/2/3 large subunit